LYTDGKLFLVDVQRPCILTGIEDLATRGDLLDRTIPLSLAKITDDTRIAEKYLWPAFEKVRPRILGALLDAVSCALKNLPLTVLTKTPRMADFALQVVAASEKLGFTPEEFLAAYNTKRDELHASVIESNLVANLIVRLVADAPFKGTAQSLLVPLEILADDQEKKSKFFPTNARGISNAIRRIAPNLRAVGYTVEFLREAGTGRRIIHLERVGNSASLSSQASQPVKNKDFFCDESCDDSDANEGAVASHLMDTPLSPVLGCDATMPPVTICDANDPPTSPQKNTSNNTGLCGKNELCDDCDATLPPYSNLDPRDQFDWSTGTQIEVGASHDTPDFEYITTSTRLEAVMPDLLSAEVIGLDTETTGLDTLKDRLRLIQIATPSQTVVIDADSVPLPLLSPLFDQPRQMIGHNLKFDFQFLIAAGLPWPTGPVFDTMLSAQLLASGTEAGLLRNCGLAAVAQRLLGIAVDKAEQKRDWSRALTPEQLIYAAKDAAILLPLADRLTDDLATADLLRIANIEHRCLMALAWMELAGLPIDRDAWLSRAKEETHRTQGLHAQLDAMLGRGNTNGNILHLSNDGPINWNSPDQVKEVFRARGHTLDSTGSESLSALLGSEPLAEVLLDYREAKKRAGTYGEAWLKKHLHTVTGRVHADYVQLGAASGRMSCTKPNVQNLPRKGSYRHAVCPGEGRAIVKADFSQIELRIAAVIANESNMLAAFRAGEDLHHLTAAKVLGIPLDQVRKEHRQLAKALNFGLLYGMGAKALQAYAATNYKVALSEAQAKEHRQRFFQAYPGLVRWHRETGAFLESETVMDTRTLAGRRRLEITRFTQALNSPVQGAGADGLKLALARLYEYRGEAPETRVIATVHDEIVAECPQDCVEQTAAWLTRHMIAAMTEILGETVPVEVETTCGRDWAGTGLAAPSEIRGAA
jgi:DNA polymerase-1